MQFNAEQGTVSSSHAEVARMRESRRRRVGALVMISGNIIINLLKYILVVNSDAPSSFPSYLN